jgi:uncharacterized protein
MGRDMSQPGPGRTGEAGVWHVVCRSSQSEMREVLMYTSGYKKAPVSSCIILLAVLVPLAGTGCKNRLMFHPYGQLVSDPSAAGMAFEDVYFKTEDGILLNGWWVASPEGRGTVLFCHGNAGNISFLVETIGIFRGMGLNVFVFDYRGFGRSGGVPTEEGTYRDVTAAWKYLTVEKKASPPQIILVGRSLGGSIAAWLARHRSPGALVLESTFTRAADVANYHYDFSPGDLLLGDAYNTVASLSLLRCPVLVVHSPEDEIVPYKLGKELFEKARGPKEFLVIHGTHNGGFMQSQDNYTSGLRRFIGAYVR